MKKEIERKFLVLDRGFIDEAVSCSRLVQGYICRESGRTVRVRVEEGGEVTKEAAGPGKMPATGRTTGRGWITIKGRSTADGTSRSEWEYEIPVEEARGLLGLCPGRLIDKERYIVPAGPSAEPGESVSEPGNCGAAKPENEEVAGDGNSVAEPGESVAGSGNCGAAKPENEEVAGQGLKWEVDVFHGAHEGLVIAEIELTDAAQPFPHPKWLGEEVTGDRRYYNSVLSAEEDLN